MLKEQIPHLVAWLQAKVRESHTKGLVVGLSGGIDSAVAAALMKKAFPEHSLGIIIPIKSHSQDAADAKLVAEQLGLTHYEVDLSEEHDSILATSVNQLNNFAAVDSNLRMADANLRARLRMTAVYTAANLLNYLVIGTDNKAEYYTGYFTKYGDGACDILPLADFTKHEIKELAKYLEIPEQIINKPPSAGLWEGQVDEDELGTTYYYIDAYLNGEQIPASEQEIIEKLHTRTEHKRNTPPIYKKTAI